MPLSDGYESEKLLKQDAEAIAEGITEYLTSVNRESKVGFVLFSFDLEESILQYISDMPREDVRRILKHWIERDVQ